MHALKANKVFTKQQRFYQRYYYTNSLQFTYVISNFMQLCNFLQMPSVTSRSNGPLKDMKARFVLIPLSLSRTVNCEKSEKIRGSSV